MATEQERILEFILLKKKILDAATEQLLSVLETLYLARYLGKNDAGARIPVLRGPGGRCVIPAHESLPQKNGNRPALAPKNGLTADSSPSLEEWTHQLRDFKTSMNSAVEFARVLADHLQVTDDFKSIDALLYSLKHFEAHFQETGADSQKRYGRGNGITNFFQTLHRLECTAEHLKERYLKSHNRLSVIS